MTEYNKGDRIKVVEDANSFGWKLKTGMKGIVVSSEHSQNTVEAAFEGMGIVSVSLDLIKKQGRRTERLVQAKNLKLSDEVQFPGSGEYIRIGNVYRNTYDSEDTTISVETVEYEGKDYRWDEMVKVRR